MKGDGTNELLPAGVAAAYEKVRKEQASKYSLGGGGDGSAAGGGAMSRDMH